MRTSGSVLGCVCSLLLALAGCKSGPPDLKPPKHAEDYTLPPEQDPTLTKPFQYPASMLDLDPTKTKTADTPAMNAGPGRPGMPSATTTTPGMSTPHGF